MQKLNFLQHREHLRNYTLFFSLVTPFLSFTRCSSLSCFLVRVNAGEDEYEEEDEACITLFVKGAFPLSGITIYLLHVEQGLVILKLTWLAVLTS